MSPYRLALGCALFCSIVLLGLVAGWSHRVQKLWPQQAFSHLDYKRSGWPASSNRYGGNRYELAESAYGPEYRPAASELYDQPIERFDDEDDYGGGKHHKVVEQHHEVKEISFVYPILLALLILGALFIPFISLFFFLSVSAFNCNGIGSGFGQVTPVFGRRRRRRRSVSGFQRHLSNGTNEQTKPASHIGSDDDSVTSSSSSSSSSSSPSPEALQEITIAHLPAIMLFDALELLLVQSSGFPQDELDFWRKQLANSTIRLRDALQLDAKLEDAAGSWPTHDGLFLFG